MARATLWWVLFGLGCTPVSKPAPPAPEADADTDADADSDADADTDADTDSDTDADSDADTDSDPDTDGDGLTDAEESALGTDPLLADTDGDGWSDAEEVDGFTDPTSPADRPYIGGWAMGACRDSVVSTGNAVGQITQDFALLDQNGDTVRLHDFCDRQVLLVSAAFW